MSKSQAQIVEEAIGRAVGAGVMSRSEAEQMRSLAREFRRVNGFWPDQPAPMTLGRPGEWLREALNDSDRSALIGRQETARDHARRLAHARGWCAPTSASQRDASDAVYGAAAFKVAPTPENIVAFVSDLRHHASLVSAENEESLSIMLGDECSLKSIQAGAMWAKGGFPFVRIQDQKWAASLMATSVPPDLVDQVHPPWGSFRVAIPGGLLSVDGSDGEPQDACRIMVMREADDTWTYILEGTSSMMHLAGTPTSALCEHVDERANLDDSAEWALTARDRRCMRLAGRVILGICMSFDAASAKGHPRRANGVGRGRSSPEPTIREYVFGRPVRVDARPYVRAFVGGERGTRGPVAVQSWVRGHWKNQPHGPGGAERKFIHIEPYWRGPEDAPIAVRPHIIDRSEGEST